MLSATKLPHLLHLMAFIVFEVKMVSAKLQFFCHIAKDWEEKGDYSAPFRSQFGWHILKVDNARTRDVTDQYRKNAAREMIFNRIAPQAEEDWIQEMRAAAHIEIFE